MINVEDKVNQHTHIYFSWGRESDNEMENKNLKIQLKKNFHHQKKSWTQDSSAKRCLHIIAKIDTYPSKLTDFKIGKKFFGHNKMKKLSPALQLSTNYLEYK